MKRSFRCTVHNFNFGFEGELPDGVDAALLQCPLCARADIVKLKSKVTDLSEHRDLLLRVIDLKQLITENESGTATDIN